MSANKLIGPKPYWRIWTGLLTILWFPLPLIGFNSHHDGYILTVTRLTRDAIRDGGAWPFNQFGSFWVFPHAFVGLMIPDEYLFITTRYLTLSFYFLTGFLIWKLAKKIRGNSFANLTLFLFFASQPFVGLHQSNFNAWPSAVAMPVLVLLALLIFDLESGRNISTNERLKIFASSALVLILILTRAQVGVLAFVAVAIHVSILKKFRGLYLFLLGCVLFCTPYFYYIERNHWFRSSISDEFVFGSIYARAGGSIFHLPIPFYTFLGTVFILLSIILYRKHESSLLLFFMTFQGKVITFFFLVLSFLVIYFILSSRSLSLIPIISVTTRRSWISLLFASLILFIFNQVKLNLQAIRGGTFQTIELQRNNFLIFLAIAAESQVWPLFDQMHSWWGSVPGVMIVALLLDSLGKRQKLNFRLKFTFLTIVVVSSIIPWFPQIMEIGKPQFPISVGKIPLTGTSNFSASKLQDFFNENLHVGERVMNLCQNADVFYRQDFVTSSSRIFVYWPQMQLVPHFLDDLMNLPADKILTCSLNELNTGNEKSDEFIQKRIVQQLTKSAVPIAKLDADGKAWAIYKKS